MAEEAAKNRTSPLVVKRIYVLAALAVSEHTASPQLRPKTAAVSGNEKAVLQELKLIDTAWHGAIAYHFLALAHRQLYLGTYFVKINTDCISTKLLTVGLVAVVF